MHPPTAEDASSLCTECGICCGWSIFSDVCLQPNELAWASSKRLRVLERDDKRRFATPCSVLEARGDARVCSDYAQRPLACREFECRVLTRYKHGELSREGAKELVARARELILSLERRLEGAPGRDMSKKLAGLTDAFSRESSSGRAFFDPEALLDIALLRRLISEEFYEGPAAKP